MPEAFKQGRGAFWHGGATSDAFPRVDNPPISSLPYDRSAVGASEGDFWRGKQMLIHNSREEAFSQAEAADPESSAMLRASAMKS